MKLRNILFTGAAIATIAAGCRKKTPEPVKVNNHRTITLSSETLTDLDYDGSWDLIERRIQGKPRQLIYKKGFGLARSLDTWENYEIRTVEPNFFDEYNKHFSVERK